MANILVGDVHGCYDSFRYLLDRASFDSSRDILWQTGDLVARGSQSLAVLRFVKSLGNRFRLCLGNHDLHLIAIHAGVCKAKPRDNLTELLHASDCDELICWLRTQPLLQSDNQLKLLMTHAGICPQWDLTEAHQCAKELGQVLSGNDYVSFLHAMYGDEPDYWSPELVGMDRLRYISNAFTRMRYCYQNGRLNLTCKLVPKMAPTELKPWFLLKRKIPQDYSVAFGHWASLGGKGIPEPFYGLDTGCCWGGSLTALRFEDKLIIKQDCHKEKNE